MSQLITVEHIVFFWGETVTEKKGACKKYRCDHKSGHLIMKPNITV